MQQVSTDIYADFKQSTAKEAVRKAGFDPVCVQPLIRLPPAARRRVELKVAGGRLGYYAARSHELVGIEQCGVLEPALEKLVLRLKPRLVAMPGLSSIHINGLDSGYDILLTGQDIGGSWQAEQDVVRICARESGKVRTLWQTGPATITLAGVKVEVPPGAFLQASRQAQALMTQRVLAAAEGAERVLDLFAGIGTYSFPLALQADVTAMEADAAMVQAMQKAAVQLSSSKCFQAQQRDLMRNPVRNFDGYDAVVINPPRAGARNQIAMLAAHRVKKLVMVSCNPATFARDAHLLKEASYGLKQVLPIDQFVYTAHLEMVAEFEFN